MCGRTDLTARALGLAAAVCVCVPLMALCCACVVRLARVRSADPHSGNGCESECGSAAISEPRTYSAARSRASRASRASGAHPLPALMEAGSSTERPSGCVDMEAFHGNKRDRKREKGRGMRGRYISPPLLLHQPSPFPISRTERGREKKHISRLEGLSCPRTQNPGGN